MTPFWWLFCIVVVCLVIIAAVLLYAIITLSGDISEFEDDWR